MRRQKEKVKNKGQGKKMLWLSIFLLALLVGCYFLFPGFKSGINEAFDVITSEDEPRIRTWVKQFGALGPIVLILAMSAQMFMLIVPNILLFIIAIVCYGPVWGSLICMAGVYFSSSLGYLIGKRLGSRAIDRFVSEKLQKKISLFVERYGPKAIAIARLSSLSSDALGFIAGILEMSYKKFILATMAGITPVIILIALYGRNGKIERALIWIAGISLIIFLGYVFIDRRRHKGDLEKS
ncbi:MAG TPA: VTT domain-containing protein [Chryseolinea sp.]|nr:VTT domain-containing protein [Chryseolinea sp.]